MTFRIDSVSKIDLNGECWLFEIKGYEGRGEYMTLYTDVEGRTPRPISAPPGQTAGVIPGTEAFFVPITATKAVAQATLAQQLQQLGWGPMVDQAGNFVEASNP
jgi:hypothetical protein